MRLQRVEEEISDLQPTDPDAPTEERIERLEDYSVRIRLYPDPAEGGKEFFVVLRDVKGADLRAIGEWKKSGETEMGMNARLITRLCTNWNGRPGVALKELDNIRGVNLVLLAEATAGFLGTNT